MTFRSRAQECDHFLWGYLKHKVFATRLNIFSEVKNNIRREIRNIPTETLECIMDDFFGRMYEWAWTVYINKYNVQGCSLCF